MSQARVVARPIAANAAEPPDPLLSIGVFARRSWLSMKALRMYDRLGLLTPAHVDGSNGYRLYRESQLATARLIAMLRRLDMPLAQVAEVVAAVDRPCAEVTARQRPDLPPGQDAAIAAGRPDLSPGQGSKAAELVASYWEAVERRITFQRELAAHLRIRLQGAEGSLEMYEVRERDVPEQVVLTEQRHVQIQELPRWLPEAMMRLTRAAQGHGGMSGAIFVIYHGQVNQDSDGPVEVCVPVNAAQETTKDLAEVPMRREPAHREAYVRLTKAQVEYPQILSAYDAVAQWMSAHGQSMAAAPREVYFADFHAAGPSDEVCDVAFPLA